MKKLYTNEGLSFQTVADDHEPAAGEVLFDDIATPDELAAAFPGHAAALAAATKATSKAGIIAQLAALDVFLPRAMEDYWTAAEFDVTKLPEIQQDRLHQKQALRAELAGTT